MKRYAVLLLGVLLSPPLSADEPIDIGSRRELMIDDDLIDSMSDPLRLQMRRPVRRNVALVTDAPWEGNACAYSSFFHDGEKYRLYYTANHYVNREGKIEEPHGRQLCYAESVDGIDFTKPKLGLVEFDGSKKNNIVLGPTPFPASESIPDIPRSSKTQTRTARRMLNTKPSFDRPLKANSDCSCSNRRTGSVSHGSATS